MSIYEVEAYTPYRGAIIKVTAECERNPVNGRIRTVKSKILGYRPNAFAGEFDRLDLRKYDLPDGGEIEVVSAYAVDLKNGRHSTETHLDKREENWSPRPSVLEVFARHFRDPPPPTPLSAQVTEVIESAREAVDTHIEDHSVDVDTDEFRHGLDSAFSKPMNGISVDQSKPTGKYDDEQEDIPSVVSTLESELDSSEFESESS